MGGLSTFPPPRQAVGDGVRFAKRAIAAMIAASILSPVIGALVRLLPEGIDERAIVGVSLWLFIPVGMICLQRADVSTFISRKYLLVLRTAFTLLSIGSTFAAIRSIDFATVYFANMMGLFLASLVGSLMLRERAKPHELFLSAVMLLGAAVALSPKTDAPATDIVLLSVVLLSCTGRVIAARSIGRTGNTFKITALSMSAVALILLPFSLGPAMRMAPEAIAILGSISVINLCSVFLASYAYSQGTISLVAPFELIKVCVAVLIGFVAFADPLSIQMLSGLLVTLFLRSWSFPHLKGMLAGRRPR